jgi:NAD(P)-dependent dehydrogenase (short-subunit alcohol dehydrogenase family)
MDYTNKVVIVTGGTKGIGRAVVERFVEAGADVVFCSHEEAGGAELARIATAGGPGRAEFVLCNVAKEAELEAFIRRVGESRGRIDCLVNNAGWHPPHYSIDDFAADDFRALLELNVVAVFVASRTALPWLRKTRGSIINLASLVATIGQHYATTYVATKGAVLAFTKALAIDEAPNGVRVNAVSPGNIYTPLWQEAIDQSPDPARTRADGEAAQPAGRMGEPKEAANLILYLASEATFTTGADHIISGGAELGYGRKVHDPR